MHDTAAPIVDDDAAIRSAVAAADVPPLLVAVAHATGDRSILRPELRPDPLLLMDPEVGYTPETKAEAWRLAAGALIAWRDAGLPPPGPATDAELHELIDFMVGDQTASYFELLREELAFDGIDLRAPSWSAADIAPGRTFTVAVVGAGMSGIVAAHRLRQAGVPVVVFEKNDDVGGTWFENTYPGCRVDVPNHLYSYSFAQTNEWPGFFSDQAALLDYFRQVADDVGLREDVRFSTEVLGADWDDDTQTWSVRTRGPDGTDVTESFNALVSAVGQLNRPSFPAIEGRERFAGESFHSARWDHDVDLAGKRVAVIGTGASAAQFIPAVAAEAGELTIFQRTPPWLVPTPNYHDALPEGLRWLLQHVPGYTRWDRLWQFWRSHEGMLPGAVVDPDWPEDQRERAVSLLNDMIRMLLTEHLKAEFPDEALFEKVLPHYPPIAKRIVRDNGSYARALAAPHVDLCTDTIAEITEQGVRTADGVEHACDVLIYGTGFSASHFLTPMRITGRGGVDLHERWGGDARAYLGIVVPEFPNLFLLYGPNTNIVINGSIIYFSECEAHFIAESVRLLLAGGHAAMACRPEVHDAYNERVDAANRTMAWGASSVSSWYKNEKGRVAQNWPFSLLEYWQQTRTVHEGEFRLSERPWGGSQ
ncbi:MAG: NAD(P)-binding protein [Acidimicrobiia bacterium]|nr:NAD(P)-binding protein [Acidimicrobiia bacterium]